MSRSILAALQLQVSFREDDDEAWVTRDDLYLISIGRRQ